MLRRTGVSDMTSSTKAWNDFRGSLVGLVSAMRKDIETEAPKAVDDIAAAAPKVADRVAECVNAAVTHLIDGALAVAPFLRRRARRRMPSGPLALAGAFAGGALLMHYLDPEKGEARRHAGKERLANMMRFGSEQAERMGKAASEITGRAPERTNGYGSPGYEATH